MTLPLIIALKNCDTAEQQKIKDVFLADKLDPKQLKEITAIIQKYEGLKKTQELAKTFTDRAKENLAPFKPSLEKEALLGLADYAVEREI